MSTTKLTALAALLIALSAQGTASAENFLRAAPDSKQAVNRLKAKIPSHAFGSVSNGAGTSFGPSSIDVVSGGKVVGRDPDPNVRLDILRDGQFATSR